ncbi:DUF6498-containing protein [Halorussus salilacus]|uniref:DUF6498-containing protein n=1 Tax=Halorussus salilacus TaxID=2953750 RepID=UPI0020A1D825|nr:DUF6498-containing protein [Halorussus salilacus]USZ67920.1 DUF6498-containing protein [Halorussus salilacus]
MAPSRRRRLLGLVSAAAANLLPLVGVAFWGWSLGALVAVYWFELGVLLGWAVVRAVFAQRPSEFSNDALLVTAAEHKRGGLSVPGTHILVRVQHLPALALLVPVLALLWLFVGAVVLAGLERTAGGGPLVPPRAHATVGVGVLGVVASQSVSTVSEYFLSRRYREVNAQMALQSALWPILVTGVVLMVGTAAVRATESGLVLLGLLVGTKLLFDLAGVYRDRLRAFDERTRLDFGWAYDPPEWPSVDGHSGPAETVRPEALAVAADGVVRGFASVGAVLLVALLTVAALGFGLSGAGDAAGFFGAVAAALASAFALAGVADRAIRYLPMEYRVDGDVVGYDRLLGEPQWRVPAWKVARAEPERTGVDRLFGTETLEIDHDDRTVRLVHLPDAAAVRPPASDGSPESRGKCRADRETDATDSGADATAGTDANRTR